MPHLLKTKTFLPTNVDPSRTSPHPQANELTAWTLVQKYSLPQTLPQHAFAKLILLLVTNKLNFLVIQVLLHWLLWVDISQVSEEASEGDNSQKDSDRELGCTWFGFKPMDFPQRKIQTKMDKHLPLSCDRQWSQKHKKSHVRRRWVRTSKFYNWWLAAHKETPCNEGYLVKSQTNWAETGSQEKQVSLERHTVKQNPRPNSQAI